MLQCTSVIETASFLTLYISTTALFIFPTSDTTSKQKSRKESFTSLELNERDQFLNIESYNGSVSLFLHNKLPTKCLQLTQDHHLWQFYQYNMMFFFSCLYQTKLFSLLLNYLMCFLWSIGSKNRHCAASTISWHVNMFSSLSGWNSSAFNWYKGLEIEANALYHPFSKSFWVWRHIRIILTME